MVGLALICLFLVLIIIYSEAYLTLTLGQQTLDSLWGIRINAILHLYNKGKNHLDIKTPLKQIEVKAN